MSDANKQLILDFCEAWHPAWEAGNLTPVMDYFTDDIIWQDIPGETRNGKEESLASMQPFMGKANNVVFKVVNIIADGNIVMAERVDSMELGGKSISTPIVGVFEIENGKIKRWRDYFDMKMFESQFPKA